MIVDNRIAGTRITVWDVLYYLEHDWTHEKTAESLQLSIGQFQAAVDYIQTHSNELFRRFREIEQRLARGKSV